MNIDDEVARAMRQLEHNVTKANTNPEAVLRGSFSATSANVTVWVDSLGRTEHCRIAPNSICEGDELLLIESFEAATREARRKAENLEFDEDSIDERPHPGNKSQEERRPAWDDDSSAEGESTWLR